MYLCVAAQHDNSLATEAVIYEFIGLVDLIHSHTKGRCLPTALLSSAKAHRARMSCDGSVSAAAARCVGCPRVDHTCKVPLSDTQQTNEPDGLKFILKLSI